MSQTPFSLGNLLPIQGLNVASLNLHETLLNQSLIHSKSYLILLNDAGDLVSSFVPFEVNYFLKCLAEMKDECVAEFNISHLGSTCWFEAKKIKLTEYGLVVYVLQDINERKQAQTELCNVYEKYKQVVENINDALVIDDVEGKVVFANKQFEQLFELSESDLAHCYFEDFIAPAYQLACRQRHEKRVTGEQNVEDAFELLGQTKSLKKIWIEVKVSTLREQGKIIGTISVIRNIHQRKLDELELERRNKELIRINEELDKFVYSTSHDLRAPLISVLRLVQICEEDFYPNDNDLHTLLKHMKEGLNRTDRVIRRILEYSKNKRFDIIPEPIDLSVLVKDLMAEMEFIQANDRIEFKMRIPEGLHVVTDKPRLSMILDHLITNAVKYQRPAEPNKFILIRASANERGVEVILEDNGEGIPSEIRPKIFDMFYRGSPTSNGSGLGLYIVKQTLKSLKGDIQVVSTHGKGTFFRFFLPYLTEDMILKDKRSLY